MRRVFTCVLLLLVTVPAFAFGKKVVERPRPQPVLTTATSDAVVVGTITAVEDDLVKIKSHPDAKTEDEYRVLVVKVDDAIQGVKNTTHIRIAMPAAEYQRTSQTYQPEGKFLFFLAKHSTTELLLPSSNQQPVNLADKKADEFIRRSKLVGAAIKDPMTALKAKEKDDRVLAAIGLVTYYRRHAGTNHETAYRPADESKLILEVLAEGDWTNGRTPDEGGVYSLTLGMNLEDFGWHALGKTGANPAAEYQEAFKKWLTDKGRDARVKQFVPKK